MAWEDVAAKFAEYEQIEYGGVENANRLLAMYNAPNVEDVPLNLRQDFEADLDYRLGACRNLVKSRAMRPRPGVYPS